MSYATIFAAVGWGLLLLAGAMLVPAAVALGFEAYRQAVDINPHDYRAWYGLGQTYEIHRMYYYALHYYRKACTLRPYDSRMWCALGGAFASSARDDGSRGNRDDGS